MRTEVPPLVERLFRAEAGRLVPMLTRLLGPEQVALAEDATQEAFIAALGHWPRSGVPADPRAWLLQVARRKALDHLRRESTADRAQPQLEAALGEAFDSSDIGDEIIADDQLRMMFLCVHPAISAESRVALTLKTVCGLSVGEIARAFLADESAVAQRLVRAKRSLRDAAAQFELPEGPELLERRGAVLDVLYLMFSAGHLAFEGEDLLRDELAREALRLAELVALTPETSAPDAHALAALICLHTARFPARSDSDGEFVRLEHQDRSRWDQSLIARGFQHLDRAAAGEGRSSFHIEAEIAAVHAASPTWQATDWARITALYDALLARQHSPVVALNRVVALNELQGPSEALAAFAELAANPSLQDYPLLYSVHAELLTAAGRRAEAAAQWQLAIELTRAEPLRRYLTRRLAESRGDDVDSGKAVPS
jgi:RNA polymerase sigma-70 factor (ECF subfamily)